jgi:hypothetical protein
MEGHAQVSRTELLRLLRLGGYPAEVIEEMWNDPGVVPSAATGRARTYSRRRSIPAAGGAPSRCDHARRTGAHALSRPGSSSRGARGPRFAERIDLPFLLGTARTSDHTPAKPLGYVLHFLVGPAFAAQTLAADLAYGTLVGGFLSLAG